MLERGAYPSPYNYYNFPKSVCTSVNEVRPQRRMSSAPDWLLRVLLGPRAPLLPSHVVGEVVQARALCAVPLPQVICHGIPDARELQDGDILNIDITAYFKG